MNEVAPGAEGTPADLKAFLKDQVEAVQILREEKSDGSAQRRIDSCYLAMRYLEEFRSGESATVSAVIHTARMFERYLLEP